ncbi:MAG: NAD(P)-dependent oxidoreductase [Phycisphaerales bacterium]
MATPTGGTLTLAIFDESSGWSLPERLHQRLAQRAGDAWRVRAVASHAQLLEAMGETVGLVGMPLTEEQLRHHVGRLRFVQLARSSGDTSPAIEAAIDGGVRIASAGTPRAPQVAEHATALALALLRRLDLAMLRQREHVWATTEIASSVRTLSGSTLGVIGAPPFVRAMAARARVFGARVVACVVGVAGVDVVVSDDVDEAHPEGRLNDVLSASDVVVVGAPRLSSTLGLLSKRALGAMKRTALLVDVSKGGVVDQRALVETLRRGRIAGAALDVFTSEPLPQTSPFWTLPSVIMTPHVSAAGEGFWDRLIDQAGENARRAATGEPLIDELAPPLYAQA